VMTIAPMFSSASKSASARPISSISSSFSAFNCFGRLSVIRPTLPRVSAIMFA